MLACVYQHLTHALAQQARDHGALDVLRPVADHGDHGVLYHARDSTRQTLEELRGLATQQLVQALAADAAAFSARPFTDDIAIVAARLI